MNLYHDYCLEDFVLDARFQQWVRFQQPEDIAFWEGYLAKNPHQAPEIKQAKTLLSSVYRRYQSPISDVEIQLEIQKLVEKARADKATPAIEVTDDTTPVVHFRPVSKWVWRAAAIVILGLGVRYLFTPSPQSTYQQITAGQELVEKINDTKSTQSVLLSDGSKVILEPNARLSFPASFQKDNRKVYLSGVAFFEVTKDAKRPFLVYANDLVTKVLGTSFLVNAQEGAQKTIVEVREGRVSVFKKRDIETPKNLIGQESKGVVLTANQKLVFEPENNQLVKTLSETPQIVSSTNELPSFSFYNTPVTEVLKMLEKAYQVDILFDEDLLSDCPLTATLTNQSLYEKLTIICEAIEAHYEVIDGQIVVHSKGCK